MSSLVLFMVNAINDHSTYKSAIVAKAARVAILTSLPMTDTVERRYKPAQPVGGRL